MNFTGTGVALITPFDKHGEIDFESLERVLDHLNVPEIDYLVVMGTTGESATLSWDEKLSVLSFCQSHSHQKPIVFGHGGNNTKELLVQLKIINFFKPAAILSVNPFYTKPSQSGLIQHYSLIADHSSCPVILYNVPSRTASSITSATTLHLSQHANIIGIKEASGNLDQCKEIANGKPNDFLLISGDDALTLPILQMGGMGVISVLANFLPVEFGGIIKNALNGYWSHAENLNVRLSKVFELMNQEGNPTSVKTALSTIGLIDNNVRLPLTSGSDELSEAIKHELKGIKKG